MLRFLLSVLIFIVTFFSSGCFAKDISVLGVARDISYQEFFIGETPQIKQIIDVEIIGNGGEKQFVKLDNILGGNPYYDINISLGDRLLLVSEDDASSDKYFVADIFRLGVPVTLAVIFCLLLLYVGRKKGLNSLVAIFFTVAVIFFLLRPLILVGANPLFVTLGVSLLATVVTMFLVGGVNKKSLAATLSTISALCVASVASILTIKFAKLTGFSDESTLFLYSSHPELNYTSIVASVMILAALGAVMDVAMSISSTINEIYINNKQLSKKDLFNAGMNVGRDMIGTMANTLILVYLGGALPMLLLSADLDACKFFNLNSVVTEISSAIIGSIALLICVPLSASIAAYFIKTEDEKVEKYDIINSEIEIKE